MPLLEITRIVWLEDIVEKLLWKHGVEEWEVIEVMESRPKFSYMSVFFVYTRDGRAIVVSARDMSNKEREKYGQ